MFANPRLMLIPIYLSTTLIIDSPVRCSYDTLSRMIETYAPIFRSVEQSAKADGKGAYFRLHRYRFAAMLAALSPVPRGSHILEVGVTPGHFTQLLVEAGYKVSGVDLNPASRQALWDRLGVEVHQTNLEREALPFAANSFDAIVFSEVIEHLVYSPLPVLREFQRVLRPGGRAVISTPNELYAKSRLRTLLRVLLWQSLNTSAEFRHQMQLEGADRYTTHSRTYTMAELAWLVQAAGMRVTDKRFVAAWEPVGLGEGRWRHHPLRVAVKRAFYGLTTLIPPARSMLLVVGQK